MKLIREGLIPINKIGIKIPNIRKENKKRIIRYAQSIYEIGLLNKIKVLEDGDNYILLSGFHRYYAYRDFLGIPKNQQRIIGKQELKVDQDIPCLIYRLPQGQSVESMETVNDIILFQLAENYNQKSLTNTETAISVFRLLDCGFGVREISKKTGINVSTISQLSMISAHKTFRNAVSTGHWTYSPAYKILKAFKNKTITAREMKEKLSNKDGKLISYRELNLRAMFPNIYKDWELKLTNPESSKSLLNLTMLRNLLHENNIKFSFSQKNLEKLNKKIQSTILGMTKSKGNKNESNTRSM